MEKIEPNIALKINVNVRMSGLTNDESIAKSQRIMTIYFCFDLIELNADVTVFFNRRE